MNLSPALSLALTCVCLSGCAASFDPSPVAPEVPIGALSGQVHGGQNPVTSSKLYLYAMGTGGVGTAATSLLKSAGNTLFDGTSYYINTGTKGEWELTGDYTCTAGQQVYVYSVGGNSGGPYGTGGLNSEIGLLAFVGTCPSSGTLASTVSRVIVNEVSTVVAAYALGGFTTSPTKIASGSSAAAIAGAANAAKNVSNVMNIGTAIAYAATYAAPATSVVPQSKINTVANMMAACVNTVSSPSSPSSACTTFFNNTRSSAGVAATDTAQAIINLTQAQAPASTSISSLYALITAYGPFFPELPAAPADLAIPITYTTPVAATPAGMAIDSAGNVWVAGTGPGAAFYSYSPQGAATAQTLHSSTGTTSSLAISPFDGHVWLGNTAGASVDVYNASGVYQGAASFTAMTAPTAIAFDNAGNANIATSIAGLKGFARFDSAHTYLSYFTDNSVLGASIVMDSNNTLWISGNAISSGLLYSASPYTLDSNTTTSATALVASSGGSVWFLSNGGQNLTSRTTAATGTTCSGIVGFSKAASLAVDGAGTLWTGNLANKGATTSKPQTVAGVSSSCKAQQTSTAIDNGRDAKFESPIFVSADAAGNLWSFNASVPATGKPTTSLTQFLGLSTPVPTPINPEKLATTP